MYVQFKQYLVKNEIETKMMLVKGTGECIYYCTGNGKLCEVMHIMRALLKYKENVHQREMFTRVK